MNTGGDIKMPQMLTNLCSGASRRDLLAAVVVGMLLGSQRPATAAPSNMVDVLDRPASRLHRAIAAPVLRLARCGRRLVAVGEHGIVLLSDDDGRRWLQAQVPVSVTLTGVQFTSPQRGYAIGHSGVVLRSDDAGQTWLRVFDGRRLHKLLSQPDLARQSAADGPDKPLLALHFSDDQNGMVVGAFGLALETTDGGQTWRSFANRIDNPQSRHLYAVHRHEDSVWIAGEQGLYAMSLNAARSFDVIATPYRGSFFTMQPLIDGKFLLGGLRGTLLLHEGGERFRTLAPASSQGVAQLLALPSQAVALVDQAGRVFTAGLADLQFKPVSVLSGRTWLAVVQASDGAFVGASLDGVSRL